MPHQELIINGVKYPSATEKRRMYRKEYWHTHSKYRAKEKKRQQINRLKRIKQKRIYNANNPEKLCWWMILNRCHNPNNKRYKDYGGRGIKCMFNSFDEFLLEVGKRPGKGYSIDRINNDGHYEPGNLRWATLSQSNKNRRMPWATSNI